MRSLLQWWRLGNLSVAGADVVLLDLSLGSSSGLEFLLRLLGEYAGARVLIFSMYSEPIDVLRGLGAEASGHISKSVDLGELVAAIRCVADGGRYIEQQIALDRHFDEPLERLRTRELDIVPLLGEGYRVSVIVDGLGLASRTVASACSVIKVKLETSENCGSYLTRIRNARVAAIPHMTARATLSAWLACRLWVGLCVQLEIED